MITFINTAIALILASLGILWGVQWAVDVYIRRMIRKAHYAVHGP